MKSKNKKNILEYSEESDNNNDEDDQFNEIEGENIVIRDKKDKVKKELNNFDLMQENLKKYEGKNTSYKNLLEKSEGNENEENEDEENEDENNEINEEKNNDKNIKSNNEKKNESNELEEENNNDSKDNNENESNEEDDNAMTLQEKMEKQDEKYLKTLSKVTKDEIKKAKNILNQKELYETFVGIRISLQNILSDVNSLPTYKNFDQFLKISNEETQNTYKKLLENLSSLFLTNLNFHKEYLIKQNYPSNEQFSPVNELEKIISNYENFSDVEKNLNIIHNNLFKIDQKILNVWYRKTVINQFQTNNKILKKLSKTDNFCEHVLNSVEKNIETLTKKTQKYNINDMNLLGRKRLSAEEYEFDKEIFNDSDFYNFLLKELLANNEKEIEISEKKLDENGIEEGRYDLTMKYLLNRNNKIKKNVDTKASKNRKIRYDKHEQIINFMVPEVNNEEITGRNIIINSLFGTKKLNINLEGDAKENEEKRENRKIEENDIDLI